MSSDSYSGLEYSDGSQIVSCAEIEIVPKVKVNAQITTAVTKLDELAREYKFQEHFVTVNNGTPHPNLLEPLGWHLGDKEAIIIIETVCKNKSKTESC